MRYYVNVVHEQFPVAHIVQETPRAPSPSTFMRRAIEKGPAGIARAALARGKGLLAKNDLDVLKEKRRRELDEILGVRAAVFPKALPITQVEDINSLAVRDLLREERPDVILVQGTSIVRDATLPDGVVNFNMHAGLSPYYRGGASTAWALVNWDPYNIGVTLHQLTERSDAGPIIAQRRVVPSEDDTSRSIEFKLTKAGAALAVKVLARLEKGSGIQYHDQDVSLGHCYFGKHLQPEMRTLIQRIDREGLIAQMLRTPSTRLRRPIVEWVADDPEILP